MEGVEKHPYRAGEVHDRRETPLFATGIERAPLAGA